VTALSLLANRLVQLGLLTAVAFAGALVLGWRAGEMPQSGPAGEAPMDWSLPPAGARDIEHDLSVLTARRPWGGGDAFADIENPAPVSAPWRLVGVVQRANQRFALILIGSGPGAKLEYRAVGDSLPDGNVLVQIGDDSATSGNDKSSPASQRVHRLFEKSP
jgi:hypothetical protein